MTAIIRENKKWVVRDRTGVWKFDTHAEAQEKANKIMVEKLKEMSQK